MNPNTNHSQKTQSISSLPLVSWPMAVVKPSTRAGQFIARRYGIVPALADVIADLAGFASEAR